MESKLVPAPIEDAGLCYSVLDQGRNFQHAQGFSQWDKSYPTPETVKSDIENGVGFVLRCGGEIAAYMCLDFGGEPVYEDITDGKWSSDAPYLVIHRMALSDKFRGKGLSRTAFSLIGEFALSKGVHYLRADTGLSNFCMQHALEKSGFSRRGTVFYFGSPRIAYEKSLL